MNQDQLILAAIVSSTDDAIIGKNLHGGITSWNPAAERIFGYTAQEVIGESLRLIVPADLQHEEDEVLRRIRAGERIEHYETVRRTKSGTVVEVVIDPPQPVNGRGPRAGGKAAARGAVRVGADQSEPIAGPGAVGTLSDETHDRGRSGLGRLWSRR